MDPQNLVGSAEERIWQFRTADAELRLSDAAGRVLSNAEVDVQLTRHEFKFGCTGFSPNGMADGELGRAYEERFLALFNYTTLPFYWGGYEPSDGDTREQQLRRMAEGCARRRVEMKGHPLVWHEVFPEWGAAYSDAEILARLEGRVRDIVSGFKDVIRMWDVVNEATISAPFDNAIGRWIAKESAAACVAQALQWAREANPSATLLYNDFNVSEDFETLVGSLIERGAPVDVIGIQSHMHKGTWTLEKVWHVCETYARYGLPLHWTEVTILSGRLKDPDDDDWHTERTDWKSTPEGEIAQAEYGEQFYRLFFSHPAVEAITWWDFSDYATWQGAPSGLVRGDMSPKPLYERLSDLVTKQWRTDARTTSDGEGRTWLRCFFGEHEVKAILDSGVVLRGSFTFCRKGERKVDVVLE